MTIFVWVYFWALYSTPLTYVSTLSSIPHQLNHCSFILSLETKQWDSSNLILLFQNCFSYSRSFAFPYKIWNQLVYILEKEMATHSSTLAWKIPWTEKPGRLQSTGSQRVGHDWATSLSLYTITIPWLFGRMDEKGHTESTEWHRQSLLLPSQLGGVWEAFLCTVGFRNGYK